MDVTILDVMLHVVMYVILTLFLAYFDVKVVRSLVAVRMARVALEIVGLAHVVLGALLLAARLPKRQARHGCSSGLQSKLKKKK